MSILAREILLRLGFVWQTKLRAPAGCPWDQEQTAQSLRPDLMEEEFGDLLLMIAMLSQINGEEGEFNSAAVIHEISTKLIRRHPHVFGDLAVDGVGCRLPSQRYRKPTNIKPVRRALVSIAPRSRACSTRSARKWQRCGRLPMMRPAVLSWEIYSLR